MDKKQNKNYHGRYLFWFAFLLTISVVATSIITTMLMNKYYFDASGAIDIGPSGAATQQEQQTDAENTGNTENTDNANNTDTPDTTTNNGGATQQEQQTETTNNGGGSISVTPKPYNPGFETSSGGIVWTTNTQVDIFKSSYVNKQGQKTVKSEDGTKLIAPGTENSFVFKLQNTGDVPLDYHMFIEAFITPDGYELPVQARLSRYDNKWLLGDNASWETIDDLDRAEDKDTIGAGNYVYYTLDWRWKFSGDDAIDTKLGNIAVDDDINLTIVITTRATETWDSPYVIGIKVPQTGDSASIVIWGTVAACSLVIIIGILVFMIILKRREDDEEENSAVEDTQIEEKEQ